MPLYLLFQMTGLDIEKDQIIEMACIVTDSDMNIIAEVGFFVHRIKNINGISLMQSELMFVLRVVHTLVYTYKLT